MKRKFFAGLVLLALALTAWAVTVKWYSQAPHATTLSTNDIFLVERPSPHTNLYATLGELKTLVGGASSGGGDQVWTNDGMYIWPVGYSAPNTNGLDGPPFFFDKFGNLLIGTNINTVLPTSDILRPLYAISYLSSNQLPHQAVLIEAADSTDNNFYADLSGDTQIDPVAEAGAATWTVESNGSTNWSKVQMTASYKPSESGILLSQHSSTMFSVDGLGLVSAVSYRDASGLSPADVGGITYNLKVVTNGTDTVTCHFTNGVLMSVTAP